MWEDYEEHITAALAAETDSAATPAMRLQAIGMVGILRSLTYPELHAAIAGLPPQDSLEVVCDWLLTAGQGTGMPGS